MSAHRIVRCARAARLAGLFAAVLAFVAAPPTTAQDGGASRVPKPALAAPAGEKCVEDPAFMRRNHPELLKHQRERTVREGIRTTRYSLANCVSCHASRHTGRVVGSADAFCESCHRYAAVNLDCFECHADRPTEAVTALAPVGVRR